MGKKIIILNGSPRVNGNTAALTAEFKRGAEAAGNEVQEFFLSVMRINGCLGCWCGGKDPEHPCSQRDDMEKIYPAYKEAVGAGWKGPFRAGEKGPNSAERKGPNTPAFS